MPNNPSRAVLRQQFEAFREKFGRNPAPNEPIFFDPDADTPQPMKEKWTEGHVEALIMDPRITGIGSFPRMIDDEKWITGNVRLVEDLGAKRYLIRFIDVLRVAFEGFGPIGSVLNSDDEPESLLMDPRAVGVGSFEPGVNFDQWIAGNVELMEDMGTEHYLRHMLYVLRHAFGAEQGAPGPRRTRPVINLPGWLEEVRRPATPDRQRKQQPGFRPHDTLGLYSYLLPASIKMQKRIRKLRMKDNGFLDSTIEQLSDAIVFDCRKLPLDFVADTGDAAFEEMQATRQPVRLPFDCCYFEFDQEIAVVACTNDQYFDDKQEELAGNIVYFQVFRHWSSPSFVPDVEGDEGEFHDFTLENYKAFAAGAEEDGLEAGARLLLGALTLLQDKLVISSQLKSDPRPWLTDHRRARGQPPKAGDVRVLTLNVPAIRNEAKRTPIGTHESPALHWRRGHWRTLHRGTPAEAQTWIRKCLVGDPDRGYVAKNYRLAATMSPLIGSDGSDA